MHSRKKGKSGSTKPVKKSKPAWVRYSAKEVEQLVTKLAKQGKPNAEIGIILRDTYGIPNARLVTKKKLGYITKEAGVEAKVPEDLANLIIRSIQIVKHLETNKKDMPSKRGLQLTESKILRLSKYYKARGTIPEDWKYEREKARLLVT